MSIIIFIIILLVLVLIHEAGHFFAAKASKVAVDEFAFGFPPRLFAKKRGETTYAFNAIPIGGYVKIRGENGFEEGNENKNDKKNFSNRHPITKIFILSAGVIMNLVLAYILITVSIYSSTTFAVDRNSQEYKTFVKEGRIRNEEVIISNIVKGSPAELSGLKVGDKVKKIYLNEDNVIGRPEIHKALDLDKSGEEITENLSATINNPDNKYSDSITFVYQTKSGNIASTTLAGIYGIEGNTDKKMIGLSFGKVATINLKLFESLKLGFEKSSEFIKLTLIGFKDLFVNLFTRGSIPKDISGPIGIFNMVGEARNLGFNYVLLFSAILSISLAIFNIIPFPALDGGRILFVIIEWISGKKISLKWQTILNSIGFIILILLMVVVTIKDIIKLF